MIDFYVHYRNLLHDPRFVFDVGCTFLGGIILGRWTATRKVRTQ